MSAGYIWLAIAGMTCVTLVTRAFFLLGGARTTLPPVVQRALRYAPAAAIAAVAVPDLTWLDGHLQLTFANYRLDAALVAALWFLWRRSMVETILAGMLVYTVLRLWA